MAAATKGPVIGKEIKTPFNTFRTGADWRCWEVPAATVANRATHEKPAVAVVNDQQLDV